MSRKPLVLKSPLRYPGGKSRALSSMKAYLPVGTTEMVSPFIGGGSFELYCVSIGVKVYAADKFYPVVTLWNCLLDPDKKSRMISYLRSYPQPITKELFYQIRKNFWSHSDPCRNAADYFIINRCGFNGCLFHGGFTSWKMKETGRNPRYSEKTIEALEAFTIPEDLLSVEQSSFEETLSNYSPEIYTYLDPPYYNISSKLYGNSEESFDIDHDLLAKILRDRRGPWLLSYNNHDKIRELYQGFFIEEDLNWKYGMGNDKNARELLILSPELVSSLGLER